MITLNGNDARVRPHDAIPMLMNIVGTLEEEVVFATCIDAEGFIGDSECFSSATQPKNLLPVDELFHLARRKGAPAVMITSRSSGPIEELHDCDVDFTERVLDVGCDLGIRVCEHVLVERTSFRLMTQSAPHLWKERGMTLEREVRDGERPDVDLAEPDAPASSEVPGEGADRQGDPDPGEAGAEQSERAEK